ncbi:MAG: YggS family pyridoxal phosphate-dependent enzyme [Candidatus Omnitrophica bacterium]|nr:YggS family pyridoxal phosphate-dependent enzyme [Candidatus Omnitrophota bacterium]MBU1923799.1 YggS family pyridoxal phosphate-dependent enzyme [Candidatus Omnitrophota bacterium]
MIKENILRVQERIAAVCARIKADPQKITVVCVTKGRSIEQILEAANLGFRYLGENRVQEAREKYKQVPGAEWQMVGHLQLNKVKEALKIFSLIHSVDSIALAQEINKQAAKINKIQDILIEVKTSSEVTKFGLRPGVFLDASKEILSLDNLRVKGLMTIAPAVDNAEEARQYFAKLKALRDTLNPSWLLSMGMTDDFEVAIEEGADIIRLGRAIFG